YRLVVVSEDRVLDRGYESLEVSSGGGGGVWRGKWGPLVAESGEGGGWEDKVWWCDGSGRD
ncbi:hypothetical protein Tco_0216607, partial [Tanacetum coccineum]